jgi:hypothetical protein
VVAGAGVGATDAGVELGVAVVCMTAGVLTTGAGVVTGGAGVLTAGAGVAGVVTAGAGVVTAGGTRVVACAVGAVGVGDVVPEVVVPVHAVTATPNSAAPTRNFLIYPPHATGELLNHASRAAMALLWGSLPASITHRRRA